MKTTNAYTLDIRNCGSEITSYVAAPQYVFPLTIAGNSASIFFVQPVGTVSGSVNQGGVELKNTSSGVGDFTFGGMLGLIGMPALPLQSYLAYKPGFSLAAVAVGMAPTGDYDRTQIFNLGTNRWAFRAAFPMSYTVGQSFADPELMTFELKPAITFFTTNDAPFGAERQTQDPYFELEGHITRNLNSALWVSADANFQYGSETATNGISDNNTRMNVQMGATVGASLSSSIQLRLSYSHTVAHNEFGLDGEGARIMAIGAF
jgi:hypothetical protein